MSYPSAGRRGDPDDCPPAYGNCTCSCHRTPGVMHIMACCHPSADEQLPGFSLEGEEVDLSATAAPTQLPPLSATNPDLVDPP